MSSRLFWSFLLLVFLSACKTGQPARPQEYYENANLESDPSTISIPVKLFKSELLQSINQQIGDVLYEDNNMKDDGMMLRAKKRENISIDLSGQEIKYRVPLDLWIKKDVMISNVEAEGSLALDFITRYNIREDWTLETKTEVSGYNWLKKPVVKLGFADLPITSIANLVLNEAKSELAGSIDKEVKDLFDLKTQMKNAWKELNDPFMISEEYNAWMLLNPQSISMTPFAASGNTIHSTVTVVSRPSILVGDKPASPVVAPALPNFRQEYLSGNDFTLFLNTAISFREAERISKQNMVGETFNYGKKTVTVQDIELYGQGNKLVVNTKLQGSYNGNVYFVAKPEYNAQRNKIELDDVDFDFSTQKFLLKSASWLFKGPLKNKVQENLDFYLNYNLEDAKKMIQEELKDYAIAPGINLNGELADLTISHVYVASDAIKVRIGMKGKLNLDVKGLGQ
jgi:hypothetical protein